MRIFLRRKSAWGHQKIVIELDVLMPQGFLVGGFNLPLWKIMEWKSVGMTWHSQLNGKSESSHVANHQADLWWFLYTCLTCTWLLFAAFWCFLYHAMMWVAHFLSLLRMEGCCCPCPVAHVNHGEHRIITQLSGIYLKIDEARSPTWFSSQHANLFS